MGHSIKTIYGTRDEIEFLQRLGSFNRWMEVDRFFTRKELLRRYVKAAELRTDWGNINKERIIRIAKAMLTQELLAEGDGGGFGMMA